MIPVLVVRGRATARVFHRLLEPEFGSEVRVFDTEHAEQAVSLARSILLRRQAVVALVTDSTPQALRQTHRSLVYLLISVECADLWKLVLMVPRTEVLLFHDKRVLRPLLGREPTAEEWLRGQSEPRQVLQQALGLEGAELDAELCRRLERVDLEPLLEHPSVRQVRQFFQAHRDGRVALPF